jgi:hypothetical protein
MTDRRMIAVRSSLRLKEVSYVKLFSRMVVGVAVMALSFAAAAPAGPPIKEPTPPVPTTFEGATAVCSFPVFADYLAGTSFSITHLDKAGDVRWIGGAGRIVAKVTNTTTGKSVAVNASGPGKITFNSDGSINIAAQGPWLLAYFPTDSPSQRLLLYRGHLVLNVATDGTLSLVSYVGAPPQDVCAMLA